MPEVIFNPMGKNADVPPGTILLEAARSAGVEIESPCGGKGTCGKCMVRVLSGEVRTESLGILSRSAIADGFVLACNTKVMNNPVVVEVPELTGYEGGKFTNVSEDTHLVQQELFPKEWQFDPLAVKWLVDVPPPRLEDGLSDLDRLTRRLQREWGKKEFLYPLSVIRKTADALRAKDGWVTATLIRESERYHVISIEPGDNTIRHYGLAVDVGTTTIALQLVFLPLAEVVDTRVDYNDQVSCGLDVISRINYARKPENLEELRSRVLDTINRLLTQVTERHGVRPGEISNAVISGNTTMVHLLLGLNPEYIRLEPYTPTILESPYLTAREVGISIDPNSWIYFPRAVGSYVGGDITAGLLCTDLATPNEDICLFIDIGTNGEIVVGNREFLMACACSAGPAFEGGGIEFGMRAAVGAIESVQLDPETGRSDWHTIGNVKPKGICGSGMISLLAELFVAGWIDEAGKLNRERKSPCIKINGRRGVYEIVPGEQSGAGKPIVISEIDIENILRAKAAIYSASALMLGQLGIGFDDLSKIYIAGGFGRYLDLESAKIIGLLPDISREKYHYIGNSSLTGARMILVSQEFREKQIDLASRITYLELNTDPSYMDQYTGALFLPHTNIAHFPTVKARLATISQRKTNP
jgi:uncharacterized 2Fe-2S/4Fe-4S cluster protein (DUF4445 family)